MMMHRVAGEATAAVEEAREVSDDESPTSEAVVLAVAARVETPAVAMVAAARVGMVVAVVVARAVRVAAAKAVRAARAPAKVVAKAVAG